MLTPLLVFTLLHPVHATYAEWEWNPQSKRIELSVRLDVLDEQAIDKAQAKRHKTNTLPRDKRSPSELLVDGRLLYLAKHFRFDVLDGDDDPNPKRYKWIGREEKGAHAWWYIEVQTKGEQAPKSIRNNMLFELDPRYIHQVRCRIKGKSTTMTFRNNEQTQSLANLEAD